jgi:hypothetical protein
VRRAQHAADAETAALVPAGRPLRREHAELAVEALGRALERASAEVGLDAELGWALLDLRDVLTSHLLAARAVADVAVGPHSSGWDSSGQLLRRGVSEVARLLDPLLASARATAG